MGLVLGGILSVDSSDSLPNNGISDIILQLILGMAQYNSQLGIVIIWFFSKFRHSFPTLLCLKKITKYSCSSSRCRRRTPFTISFPARIVN